MMFRKILNLTSVVIQSTRNVKNTKNKNCKKKDSTHAYWFSGKIQFPFFFHLNFKNILYNYEKLQLLKSI